MSVSDKKIEPPFVYVDTCKGNSPANGDVSIHDRQKEYYQERETYYAPPKVPSINVMMVVAVLVIVAIFLFVWFPSFGASVWNEATELVRSLKPAGF